MVPNSKYLFPFYCVDGKMGNWHLTIIPWERDRERRDNDYGFISYLSTWKWLTNRDEQCGFSVSTVCNIFSKHVHVVYINIRQVRYKSPCEMRNWFCSVIVIASCILWNLGIAVIVLRYHPKPDLLFLYHLRKNHFRSSTFLLNYKPDGTRQKNEIKM